MTQEQFIEILEAKGYPYERKDGKIVVNGGWVALQSLTVLPEGVQFNNGGGVDLEGLTTLPEGVQFNNGGGVGLEGLTTLPEGVQFNNGGWVNLESLTVLPEGVQFNNGGWVGLSSLTEWDAEGCGCMRRNIKVIHGERYGYRVSLGCFIGTEEEAVAAIRKKYGNRSEYEQKVVAAFAKYK